MKGISSPTPTLVLFVGCDPHRCFVSLSRLSDSPLHFLLPLPHPAAAAEVKGQKEAFLLL